MEQVFANALDRVREANRMARESALELNRIAVRAQGELARQQLAALENCLEAGSKQLELMTQTQDPKELVSKQTQTVASLGEKLVGVVQQSLEIQAQAREEFKHWFEDGMAGLREMEVEQPAPAAAAPSATASKPRRTPRKAS